MQSIKDAARKCSVFAYVPADVASSLAKGGRCRRKKGLPGPPLYALLADTKGKGTASAVANPGEIPNFSSGTALMRLRHSVAQKGPPGPPIHALLPEAREKARRQPWLILQMLNGQHPEPTEPSAKSKIDAQTQLGLKRWAGAAGLASQRQ